MFSHGQKKDGDESSTCSTVDNAPAKDMESEILEDSTIPQDCYTERETHILTYHSLTLFRFIQINDMRFILFVWFARMYHAMSLLGSRHCGR